MMERPHSSTKGGGTLRTVAGLHLAWLVAVLPAAGQTPVPTASLDTATILIGEQVQLELAISYRADQGPTEIQWPLVTDTLTAKVPVLYDGPVDTILPDKAKDPYLFKLVRTLTITSWDSGYWAIPPFQFVVNGQPAETEPLLLTVNTVPVDLEKGFYDIKEIYIIPFNWGEWLRGHWKLLLATWGVAVVLVILLYFLFIRPKRQRQAAAAITAPQAPLHARTLLALEALQQKKLWQQDRTKAYYTELTEIIRGYLQERYGVAAMEQTTDELLAALRMSAMPGRHQEQLTAMLRLADMVKFAKWKAQPTENEQAMANAIRLVQETAEVLQDAPLT